MLTFGVTVLPDPPFSRFLELVQLSEKHGFEYAWTYDSHILWQESYATLPVVADHTERIKLGHFVTNPGIRDATVTASWYATMQDLSNGRMVMGIGRGDSSRRVVGLKPVRVAEFEARCAMMKELMNGRKVAWNEKELELTWVRDELPDIEMWIAGYGPRGASRGGPRRRRRDHPARRPADHPVDHGHGPQVGRGGRPRPVGAQVHRRRPEQGDRRPPEGAGGGASWFPAMVSNHVMDLIEKYGFDSEIPEALTEYVKARKFYDYKDHSRVGAAHGEFVTDEICDRFTVIGNVAQCVEKLRELEVRRRRPVQHLPDDPRPGGDAQGLRRRDHPGVREGRRLALEKRRRRDSNPRGRDFPT